MTADSHVRRGHPITLALVILIAIIELCISAWLTARYNQHHNFLSTSERDRVRFLLFCSVWTILLSPLFLTSFLTSPGSILSSVAAHGIFLFMTWVFWLSGAAALSESLGGRLNCSHHFVYCGQLNALEAFAWIEWVILTFAFVVVVLMGSRAMRRGDGYRGPLVAV
ncbi:hypothetical protein BV25DRAFT_1912653 [Artomyces pyxidatus]|uniref:Uncharacterized protein n=1 Tax=Artomyces pyxidatus TaxID=48021 RepID=A0ACB8TDW4_9AGAM|nr:hypothetical protein BV25DRAFT_1912653 [Artomyces pyxidatus]